jgi:hypothetical protein
MPPWAQPAPTQQTSGAASYQTQPAQQPAAQNVPETITIIPIDREGDEDNYQLTPGADQLFGLRDESVIISVTRRGNVVEKTFYDKRIMRPQQPFNPAAYPTREEMARYVDQRVSEIAAPAQQIQEVRA